MFQLRKVLMVMVLGVVFSGLSTSMALAQDPANGKVVWEEQSACQRCHGPAGEGLWAGPLAGNEKAAQEWIDQVRTPRRNMPAFSAEQVSDEQIIDMHAYMASLAKVDSFAPMDAGLPADAPQGQMLIVEKRCVACHSTTGPIKGFIERGEVPTAEAITTQVRTPRRNMPSFTADQVSDAELALIADFMAAEVAEQAPPATLPTSGSSQTSQWPFVMLFVGGGLVLGGLAVKKSWAK